MSVSFHPSTKSFLPRGTAHLHPFPITTSDTDHSHPPSSDLAQCDSPVLEETPTTATTSLPTPGPPATVPQYVSFPHLHSPTSTNAPLLSIFAQSDQQFAFTLWHDLQPDCPPPAPMLKDMDSFTEGTAVGSFDFSLRSSWSSENFPDRPPQPSPPKPEIESWRTNVLMSTSSSSFASSSASRTAFGDDDDGDDDDDDGGDHATDISYEHSLDPASWQATPTRAPKRQLSYTSVDGEHSRGRKLIRHSAPIFAPRPRSYSQSVVQQSLLDDCDDLDHSVDRSRSTRSSSAPLAIQAQS